MTHYYSIAYTFLPIDILNRTILIQPYIWKLKRSTYAIHILVLYIGSGFYIDVFILFLSEELKQIKEYLKMIDKPKFGKADLEKVRNGVDLLPLLQERDLHGINNLSFIKTILKHMKRDDLLKEVYNYEKESAKAADAKSTRPKSGN